MTQCHKMHDINLEPIWSTTKQLQYYVFPMLSPEFLLLCLDIRVLSKEYTVRLIIKSSS